MTLPEFLKDDGFGVIGLTGHRIGLQDIVFFYNEGFSAEMLLCEFPTLSLALIHKVIAFYLDHQAEVDEYVAARAVECERLRAEAARSPGKGPTLSELRERLAKMHQAKAG